MRETQATVISLLDVEPRPERNEHIGRVQHLDGVALRIAPALVEAHPGLLYGGMWGRVDLGYDLSGDAPVIEVCGFTPFQLFQPDVGEFKAKPIRLGDLPPPPLPEEGRSERDVLDERLNQNDVVGQTTLLYTCGNAGGGDRGFVQCVLGPARRRLSITGKHGATLHESIRAAEQALLAHGTALGLSPQRLAESGLAVHLVDIAQDRDGPSAGLAFALAMFSSATGRPLRRGLAVTGEAHRRRRRPQGGRHRREAPRRPPLRPHPGADPGREHGRPRGGAGAGRGAGRAPGEDARGSGGVCGGGGLSAV